MGLRAANSDPFLYDGRTDDLLQAVQAHYSNPADCDVSDRSLAMGLPKPTQSFGGSTSFLQPTNRQFWISCDRCNLSLAAAN